MIRKNKSLFGSSPASSALLVSSSPVSTGHLAKKQEENKKKRTQLKDVLRARGWSFEMEYDTSFRATSPDSKLKLINDTGVVMVYDMERGHKGALVLKLLLKDIEISADAFKTKHFKFTF